MVKKALLILAEGFEEMEAVIPMDLLRRAGVEVTVAGLKDFVVKSARGVLISADQKLDQISGEFDVLILPGGGGGAKNLAASEKVKNLVLEMNKKKKWIAAICASPVLVLAPIGILHNKSAVCYTDMEKGFDKSTKYVREKVVVDGNIITSMGPATAVEFALTIIEKLCGQAERDQVKTAIIA